MTHEEFKQKVVPVSEHLYRLALRILQNSDEAKDIVQETMIRLWQRKNEMMQYRSLLAFSSTIARNLAFDKIRLRKPVDEIESANIIGRNDASFETKEKILIIRQLVAKLPEQQRLVMQLKDFDGLSSPEIEELLGITANTIRVNLSLARKKIREEVTKIYNYGLEAG